MTSLPARRGRRATEAFGLARCRGAPRPAAPAPLVWALISAPCARSAVTDSKIAGAGFKEYVQKQISNTGTVEAITRGCPMLTKCRA